jgi:mannose-6-phosphate isomerase
MVSMGEVYPIQLLPEFHERVWGTRDLSLFYPSHKIGDEPIGEAWLTGEGCRVANGAFAGQTLADVTQKWGARMWGTAAAQERFPLLVKIIFPKDKLSVQVHPDDAQAREYDLPCGKTECWYVLHTSPGAHIGLGFKRGVSVAEVEQSIRETRMEQLLNWIDVVPGDLYYVDAGTVHAIGPGCVMLETQQNSDTTYRLYDYGRPRELHVERGLKSIKTETRAGKVKSRGQNGRVTLVESPCFAVDKIFLKASKQFHTEPGGGKSSPHCLIGLRGCGVIEAPGCAPITLGRGETAVVPAGVGEYTVRPQWEFEFVRSMLPAGAVALPETTPAHELMAAPLGA